MIRALLKKQLLELGAAFVRSSKTGKQRSRVGTLGYALLFAVLMLLVMLNFGSMALPLAVTLVPQGLDWLYFVLMELSALTVSVLASAFTSEAYARKNMNRTHEELFREAEQNVKFLHDHGVKHVFANVGTIFGCPVQGEVLIERAYEFVDRTFSIGFDEIEHSDTEGTATPDRVYEYFSNVLEKYPDRNMHSFHVHDVYGMGMTAYYAAAQAGVSTFDCSMGGIGGQVANIVDGVPVKGAGAYYYDNCRTGLVETCDFVTMLNGMGVETGVDEHKCYQICRMLERILGRRLDSFPSHIQ